MHSTIQCLADTEYPIEGNGCILPRLAIIALKTGQLSEVVFISAYYWFVLSIRDHGIASA